MSYQNSSSIIGKNSNNNMVFQNSNITNIVAGSPVETVEFMARYGAYDDVQEYVQSLLSSVRSVHPLFPRFSATYSSELQKLVSTPETADAFEKHPKKIKGTFQIDYKKYPNMDKSETPWEYAYRTQTEVKLATKAYKEYLGDTEDPFPVVEYSEGMVTTIGFNEFPPAISATIKSGNAYVDIMLRRKPSLKFGELIIGNESSGHGFNISINTDNSLKSTTVNFFKVNDCDLNAHLACERLLDAIYTTKEFAITTGNIELMSAKIDEAQFESNIFKNARILKVYIENLIKIEQHTGCKFNPDIGEIPFDDIETSVIMAASFEGKWRLTKLAFDDVVRCDYDHIPNDIADYNKVSSESVAEMKVLSIDLHGETFVADKFVIVYKGAKINNIESVIKNKQRKKKDILLTMKPADGKDVFYKYQFMEGIAHV